MSPIIAGLQDRGLGDIFGGHGDKTSTTATETATSASSTATDAASTSATTTSATTTSDADTTTATSADAATTCRFLFCVDDPKTTSATSASSSVASITQGSSSSASGSSSSASGSSTTPPATTSALTTSLSHSTYVTSVDGQAVTITSVVDTVIAGGQVSATSAAASASSSAADTGNRSFLANKTASGVVFGIVGVIGLVVLISIATFAMRRSHKNKLEREALIDAGPDWAPEPGARAARASAEKGAWDGSSLGGHGGSAETHGSSRAPPMAEAAHHGYGYGGAAPAAYGFGYDAAHAHNVYYQQQPQQPEQGHYQPPSRTYTPAPPGVPAIYASGPAEPMARERTMQPIAEADDALQNPYADDAVGHASHVHNLDPAMTSPPTAGSLPDHFGPTPLPPSLQVANK